MESSAETRPLETLRAFDLARQGWVVAFALLSVCARPLLAGGASVDASTTDAPLLRFHAREAVEAVGWQKEARARLFALMMGGDRPDRVPLQPVVLRELEPANSASRLQEIRLRTLDDRTVHAWIAVPRRPTAKVGGVLALHGHGGTGEKIVRGEGPYGYGRTLVEMGYAVVAPDIGQHDLQHTNWSLMGERVWDALCCVDYLVTRPEVDTNRLAVAGLSLGGETTMYVAALDERLRLACSSGWLTTVDNMKRGHCPCWNFPGLAQHFDFSDIFALVAPRLLVVELGEQERAPGGFPVEVGRRAFERIQGAYAVFDAKSAAVFTVHQGGHVFVGRDFWPLLRRELGVPRTPRADPGASPGQGGSPDSAKLRSLDPGHQ
ncbi:MAG TPA: alpha/beta hydrolase family protein [Candidatus Paceibacterota bacterium]|nr:alpha/beta hydrolase family protein [Candidatus Paceibacterota bacterium]